MTPEPDVVSSRITALVLVSAAALFGAGCAREDSTSPVSPSVRTTPAGVAVYPSGQTVPERLLRISLRFGTAPVPGVLDRLELLNEHGGRIDSPFIPEELWSPDGLTLTVVLDPGRVKSGLGRHERIGRPVPNAGEVTLTLDGDPIKTWRVSRQPTPAVDPKEWKLSPPPAASRLPLRVAFPGAIDIQSEQLLAVVDERGERVAGVARLVENEMAWTFSPKDSWQKGPYRLLVHPKLENPAGDSVSEPFSMPVGATREAPVLERAFIATDTVQH